MSVTVTLPDGKALQLTDGATGADAAAAIGPGLARAALAVEVSHPDSGQSAEVRDLTRALPNDASIAIITDKSGDSALELIRHDAAHVLAAAVMELYPGVKISIGPPIAEGFYYDFEFPSKSAVSEADFPAIEERMREHIKAAEAFERQDVSPQQARERFLAEKQDYKVELIDDLVSAGLAAQPPAPLQTVSLYTNGPFTDLCRGPHAPTTSTVKAFKLLSTAGAYWRGDSNRTMLTRIYGTAFHSKADLEAHLERIEQARARDHRKLGRELGLFHFSDVSPGAAFWLPAGTSIWNTLLTVSRRMGLKRGYTEVKTPLIYDAELWKTSGHWGKYRENMFTVQAEEREMGVKPMNCPGHAHLYSLGRHSYRDLPLRYS
ncbi:MAG: TGS domain-containing protein, partial [Solirubrobacteraceae bacterium]